MFDLIAGWFAVGLFAAGVWIIVGALLPVPGIGRGGRDGGPRP